MKKVAIIGSGPAGIFSALELSKKNPDFQISIFEKTPYSSGGMINDCKLNLSPKIGMDIEELKISGDDANILIIAGFSDVIFNVISAFVEADGSSKGEYWVKKIE